MAAKVTPADLWKIKLKITGPTKSILEVDGYFSTEAKDQICNAVNGNLERDAVEIESLREALRRIQTVSSCNVAKCLAAHALEIGSMR